MDPRALASLLCSLSLLAGLSSTSTGDATRWKWPSAASCVAVAQRDEYVAGTSWVAKKYSKAAPVRRRELPMATKALESGKSWVLSTMLIRQIFLGTKGKCASC